MSLFDAIVTSIAIFSVPVLVAAGGLYWVDRRDRKTTTDERRQHAEIQKSVNFYRNRRGY